MLYLFVTGVVLLAIPLIEAREWSAFKHMEYYVEMKKVADYDGAIELCRNKSSDLAVIKTADVRHFITKLITSQTAHGPPYAFYIDLKRTGNNSDDFVWGDGTALNSATAWWELGEPDYKEGAEDYVIVGGLNQLSADFKWRDVAKIQARYVCQRIHVDLPAMNDNEPIIAKEITAGTMATKKHVTSPHKLKRPVPFSLPSPVANKSLTNGVTKDDDKSTTSQLSGLLKLHDTILRGARAQLAHPYSVLSLIGMVAVGAVIVATIVFVISYVMEKRNNRFV